ADRGPDGGVTEGRPRGERGVEELAVMDQQVDGAGELEGRRMVDAHPGRALAEHDRAVVRKVGEGRAAGADPVAIGQPAFVRNFPRHHLKALDGSWALLDAEEPPFSAELRRLDREMRR